MNAASRNGTRRWVTTVRTASYAAPRVCTSSSSTRSAVQRNCWRFCTHSKYETVTPPALARMSGITGMPRSFRSWSATGVMGAFAPSTISRARTSSTFLPWITLPSAAGTRTSTSSVSGSSLRTTSTPGVATTEPFSTASRWTRSRSSPSPENMPPPTSLTATTRAPSPARNRALQLPTLPKP